MRLPPLSFTGQPPRDGPGFRRHLDELDLGIRTLCTLVIDGVPRATEAFLCGDDDLSVALAADHEDAKALPEALEAAVSIDIARRSPMGSDLRLLITVLRVAPPLGRCLELIEHISDRRWVGPLLPAEAASAFATMGRLVTGIWEEALAAWCDCDAAMATRLAESDAEVNAAVQALPELLRQPDLSPLAAMQAVTVGRFYQRLGEHAVEFANRIRWSAQVPPIARRERFR